MKDLGFTGFRGRSKVGCLVAHLLVEEHAKGTTIFLMYSDSFLRKVIESGEDLSLLFPLRGVLLSFINSISSSC